MNRLLSFALASLVSLAPAWAGAYVIDGPYSHPVLHGNEQATLVVGADVAFMDAFAGSSVDMRGGSVSWLDLHDTSTASVSGGELSWLTVHDNASASVSGGDVSWLRLYEQGSVRLTGVQGLGWLVFNGPDTRAEIVASNVSYARGQLSGVWGDGRSFSFRAVHGDFLGGDVMPANISITAVPEPGSLLLFAAALPILLWQRRRRVPVKP